MEPNPYQTPADPGVASGRSLAWKRLLVEGFVIVGAALLGAVAVYCGEAYRWPGFQLRSGYIGDVFGTLLVDQGNERVLRILAVEFACYGAIAATMLILAVRLRESRHTSQANREGI